MIFVPTEEPNPLTGVANYIKVDFRAMSPEQQVEVARRFGQTAVLAAEKVDTLQEFERAKAMCYTLFQGYFFARPIIVSTTEITGSKLRRLRILQQPQHPDMDFPSLTRLLSKIPAGPTSCCAS